MQRAWRRTHGLQGVVRPSGSELLDGVCDEASGFSGCEVRGVDDFGIAVQPGARCFGVGLEVGEAEG